MTVPRLVGWLHYLRLQLNIDMHVEVVVAAGCRHNIFTKKCDTLLSALQCRRSTADLVMVQAADNVLTSQPGHW